MTWEGNMCQVSEQKQHSTLLLYTLDVQQTFLYARDALYLGNFTNPVTINACAWITVQYCTT